MTRVFVTRNLPGDAVARLADQFETTIWPEDRPAPPEVLQREIVNADGLLCTITDQITPAVMDLAPNLKVISNYGVGYDNIDVAAATARRIAVCNTPGVLTEATADLAFGLLLAAARRMGEAERMLRANQWGSWSPTLLIGQPVAGSTLGIVGLGAIGRAVARRASGFAMHVLYTSRTRAPQAEAELGVQWRANVDDLLPDCDFVVLAVPLTPETRGLINAGRLANMKRNAILVNISRGPVVDQRAIYEALRDKTIAAAGLDVFDREPLPADDPLRTLENAVLLPHIGSADRLAREGMAALAAENLTAVLQKRPPPACVNPHVAPYVTM